jgi:AraC-like DNA-binding protein
MSDIFSALVSALRIRSMVLLHESYASPWAVAVPDSKMLGNLLGDTRHSCAIAFHLVRQGACEVDFEGELIQLETNDLLFCLCGTAHTLQCGANVKPIPLAQLLESSVGGHQEKNDAASLSLSCGAFILYDLGINPLVESFPKILKLNLSERAAEGSISNISQALLWELGGKGSGASYMRERLLEILLVNALRNALNGQARPTSGVAAGMLHPTISRCMQAIHDQPHTAWTLRAIANTVSLSPSRLSALFKECVGMSPIQYVAQWKTVVARRMLTDRQTSITQIAENLGYDSVLALNRAFARHVGSPPGAWRKAYFNQQEN